MDVIAHIMTLAKERDWTQYRLAREANLPQTTIANIYNRGSVPSIVTLEMICKAFDMTLSEFFMSDADKETRLTGEQKRLLSYFDALSPSQQQVVTELLQNMVTSGK